MRKGTYFYSHGYPTLKGYSLRVEVIGETAKSYRVRYLGFHANGAPPGTVTWVALRKVKIDGEAFKPTFDIRKPYKD